MKLSPFRALNHYGMGGSSQDLSRVAGASTDWMLEQIQDKSSPLIPKLTPSSQHVAEYMAFRELQNESKRSARDDQDKLMRVIEAGQAFNAKVRSSITENFGRRFEHSINTVLPLKERFALFWSNHFCISRIGRAHYRSAGSAYENETIRANLNGSFAQMLLAVASHPVMLIFLDNFQSVGPNTHIGVKSRRGLNENFARELLELHTLGVDGGYTQNDVRALAKILTGWTVNKFDAEEEGKFYFDDTIHESGTHRLLGKAYKDSGYEQGVLALHHLAGHPSTARHIADKLIRHFVSDVPKAEDVAVVEHAFLQSEGDLPTVHEAVCMLKNGWNVTNRKLRTPYEFLVAVYRGLEIDSLNFAMGGDVQHLQTTLKTLNHEPFTAPSPAGWGDTAEFWNSPTAIKQRMEWGVAMGAKHGNQYAAIDIIQYMLGPKDAKALVPAIRAAASPSQALALLLASPNLQWR